MMIKKKNSRLLWPTSKCCLKKFFDMDFLAKNGSIFVVIMFIGIQIFNIVSAINYEFSFISLIINLFFLVVVLAKIEIIKFEAIEKYIDITLKIMIFIFLLNFIGYLSVEGFLYNYVIGPISFLGAYFIFLLTKREAI